jgi:hypothetical protein
MSMKSSIKLPLRLALVLLDQHIKFAKSENRANQLTLDLFFGKFYTKIFDMFLLKLNLDVHREFWICR